MSCEKGRWDLRPRGLGWSRGLQKVWLIFVRSPLNLMNQIKCGTRHVVDVEQHARLDRPVEECRTGWTLHRIRVSRCPQSHYPSQCPYTGCTLIIHIVLGLDNVRGKIFMVFLGIGNILERGIYIYI